jgi:hypothetical protein
MKKGAQHRYPLVLPQSVRINLFKDLQNPPLLAPVHTRGTASARWRRALAQPGWLVLHVEQPNKRVIKVPLPVPDNDPATLNDAAAWLEASCAPPAQRDG